jgi:hypothetical protein
MITSAQVLRKMNELQHRGGELISTWHDLRRWLREDEQISPEPLYTDSQGRQWHIIERDNGSISVYYVLPDGKTHILYDSFLRLEGQEADDPGGKRRGKAPG